MTSNEGNSPHYSGRLRGMRISEEQFNQLLLSYRTSLTDHTAAAKNAGVSYGTAKKAFNVGVTVDGVPRQPIADTVATELRAAVVELDRLKVDQSSRTDLIITVERELIETQMANVQMSRGAASNATAGLALTANLLNGAISLSARLSRALEDPSFCPSPRDAASLLRVILHTSHFAMESARTAQELEKAIRDSVDIKKATGGMTIEEAHATIESAGRSSARLARSQARKALIAAAAESGSAEAEVMDADFEDTPEEVEGEEEDLFAGEEESRDYDHRP